jgi:chromate transporter
MVAIAAAAFLGIYFFKVPFPWIVLGAAVTGLIARLIVPRYFEQPTAADSHAAKNFVIDRMHDAGQLTHTQPNARRALKLTVVSLLIWMVPVALVAAWLGADHVLTREGTIFGQTAVVTFGGAYAVLAYVGQRAVEELHWLRPGEMIDGLAMAETTPGPLIMVLQFVGFLGGWQHPGNLPPLLAATLGALITTWTTFVPCFLWIFLGAPHIEQLRKNVKLTSALATVTAAVVGVVLNLAVWFGGHVLFPPLDDGRRVDVFALALAAIAFVGLWRWKWSLIPVIAGAGILGVVYQFVF